MRSYRVLLLIWGLSVIVPKGSAFLQLTSQLFKAEASKEHVLLTQMSVKFLSDILRRLRLIQGNPDIVLWPEDVVNLRQLFIDSPERSELSNLAQDLDTWLLAGIFERLNETSNANATVAIGPDGEIYDRYDKVRLVPFGEYVPLRSLIEPFAPEYLPVRDTVSGTGPPNLSLNLR